MKNKTEIVKSVSGAMNIQMIQQIRDTKEDTTHE